MNLIAQFVGYFFIGCIFLGLVLIACANRKEKDGSAKGLTDASRQEPVAEELPYPGVKKPENVLTPHKPQSLYFATEEDRRGWDVAASKARLRVAQHEQWKKDVDAAIDEMIGPVREGDAR